MDNAWLLSFASEQIVYIFVQDAAIEKDTQFKQLLV